MRVFLLRLIMRKRDSHIFAKAKNGWYVEPSWCSERLFEEEKFPGTIWDPAVGWGTITLAAHLAGYRVLGSDIVDRKRHKLGRGFFKYDFLNGVEKIALPLFSVVTNPPFDHVEEFAYRAFEKLGAQKVAMIMLVRRLNAAHWLCGLPLKKIWLLTPRPSMPPGEWIAAGHKPGGGTQDFCWVVIERGYQGAAQIDWLVRDDSPGALAWARKDPKPARAGMLTQSLK
jgi:hypothetical protein